MVNAIRNIFIWLDSAVYSFVETMLQLIIDLANFKFFSESLISEFSNRIYILLGLVMLFKIILSFIQILINPDKMDDKEQGVAGILKRAIISLALIVLVPGIFDMGRQLQTYIMPVIPKVVLGTTADLTSPENGGQVVSSVSRQMAFYTFLAFFNYNEGCDDGSIMGTGSSLGANVEITPSVVSVSSAVERINDRCMTGSGYKYDYRWLLSTAAGVYLGFVFIQMAIAIAIRAIKLGICEFIAPIPIASYIDPKASKQAFDNWVSTSIKTYLDLFSRFIIIYFVLYVFTAVVNAETLQSLIGQLNGGIWRSSLVIVFIIFGLFKFAKDAPKFITDLMGIKDDGGDIMGMFKGAASMMTATAGAGVAGIGNMINARHNDKSWIKAVGSGLAGAGSGLISGNRAALSGKSVKESFTASTQTPWTRRQNRIADRGTGVRIGDRLSAKSLDYFQIKDDISLAEDTIKANSTVIGTLDKMLSIANERYDKAKEVGVSGAWDGKSDALNRFGEAFSGMETQIRSNNNKELNEYLDKFIGPNSIFEKKNGKWQVKSGESFNVKEVAGLAMTANTAGLGTLSTELQETAGDFKKEFRKDITSDRKVRDIYGSAVVSGSDLAKTTFEHPEYTQAVAAKDEAFAKARIDLDVNVAKLEALQHSSGAAAVKDELTESTKKVQEKIAQSGIARGRESNQRRSKK